MFRGNTGMGDGKWTNWRQADDLGATLHVGPVFSGEVSYSRDEGPKFWRCTLNGQSMGGYPTMAGAKARIDWEIWNRVRQMREGYAVLLTRKAEWEDGGNKPRPPEVHGVPA